MERRKVSIIIPTYNSERTLERCLQSVKGQSYPFCEIVIVDGFSADHTIEIAGLFQAKIVRQECNAALARNIGIRNSNGSYVLFLDSDQALSPLVVAECVTRCEDEGAGMVIIPETFIGSGFWGSCSAIWKDCYQKVEQLYEASGYMHSGEPRFFVKEQTIRVGMLNTALIWGEDYDLHERLRKARVKEATCESNVYHYELESLNEIFVKNFRYGKFVRIFEQQTGERMFSKMLWQALLTFRSILRGFKRSPAIIMGCMILLCLKTSSMAIGSMIGWQPAIDR